MLAEDLCPTANPLRPKDKHGWRYYTERICEGCGGLSWMTKEQRFCSQPCADKRGRRGARGRARVLDVGYSTRHSRVRRARGKADHCIHRNAIGCTSQKFEWAQIHGTDGLSIYDYVSLCKQCHALYDYRRTGVAKVVQVEQEQRKASNMPAVQYGFWASLRDGEEHVLTRPENFTINAEQMRQRIYGHARYHGMVAETHALGANAIRVRLTSGDEKAC